jgi:PBS lyase HEAT-like repeat-containing protein
MSMEQCQELRQVLASGLVIMDRALLLTRLDALTGMDDCIQEGLVHSALTEDWLWFERYVLAASRHPSRAMVPVLCQVLSRRIDEVNSEDIVEVLSEIGDPDSVDCLRDTLLWQPGWDEFHGLAIKCVWALAAIGSAEAVGALRDAAGVGPEEIRDAAVRALSRLAGPESES